MRSRINNRNDNDAYFEILCGLAGLHKPVKDCGYFELMYQLYRTEFYYSVPNDDNRGEDGIKLREKYGFPNVDSGCCLLEMLMGLAIRCDREIMYDADKGDQHVDWFWMMLTNLGLNKMRDSSFDSGWNHETVSEICDTFMDREYAKNGRGGLFPLKAPHDDQRKVEIWYQCQVYLMENYTIGDGDE